MLLAMVVFSGTGIATSLRAETDPAPAAVLAGHAAHYDSHGYLLSWTAWNTALDLEMQYYQHCPAVHGYPGFVAATFLDADCAPQTDRTDTIPATLDGMGILSYLKFNALRHRRDGAYLDTARAMGDYLVKDAVTPDNGAWPRFTRSTGKADLFPQPEDSGTQADHPYEIQPDKGGIAGYALFMLYKATNDRRYLDSALHHARVLTRNQQIGDATHSPWPFRVDFRSGAGRGPVAGNMTYILRLYDALLGDGYGEFATPRRELWQWIKRYQIPSAQQDGALFAQFFEDHDNETNRTAWAPLNLARYLLEKKSALDPDWRADAKTLIDFVRRDFTHVEAGVRVCHEQDEDHDAWGGVNSTYGAVLALYARATGSRALAVEAREALNFTLYAIDERGRPRDLPGNAAPGGWQEDAHTDVIHNFVDALRAFPQWATQIQ